MIATTWIAQQVTIFQDMIALNVYDGGDEVTRQMLCPVHADQRPSARVYAEENRVHCYTCGRGWDLLGLVMAVRRCSFPEAGQWVLDTFKLGTPDDLTGQLREALQATAGTTAPLFAHAERSIRAARGMLSCEQFTKLTMALDTVYGQFRSQALDRIGVQRDVGRILKRLQQVAR